MPTKGEPVQKAWELRACRVQSRPLGIRAQTLAMKVWAIESVDHDTM